MVAEVDFDLIKSKEMNPITPVLIYNIPEDKEMKICEGQAEAGKTQIISLEDKREEDKKIFVVETDKKDKNSGKTKKFEKAEKIQAAAGKKEKKKKLNFYFD